MQKLNKYLLYFIEVYILNFILNSILGNDLYEADKVTFQEVRVKKQDTLRDVLKLFAVQTGHATERLVNVILFEIDCAIFYKNLQELLSAHKLNKLGKFW